MSLINKMLQDLDARGSGGAASAVQQDEVKPVPSMERDRRPLMLGGVAAGVLVLAAAGWYGWNYWQPQNTPPPAPIKIADNRAIDKPRFQQPPAAKPAEAASAGSAAVAPSDGAPAAGVPASPIALHGTGDTKPKRAARAAEGEDSEALVSGGAAASHAPSRKAARGSAAAPSTPDGVVMRELTPKQASENSYRRALMALQEGRVSIALADLDRAVEIDPRNDAARQTYVSLLLENRRTDDAIRQLRLALGIDPRQPGLAIILARLQLEKGGPALDTLLKTLPYAGSNSDYHGFLAGVLQREQRHSEAADHYRAALQLSPQNGVWWMGLGISLQAEQHLPEAREAYNRARSAGGLTPDLRGYVDRQLEKLSR
jgi:MSHA biogenesis protein MshN